MVLSIAWIASSSSVRINLAQLRLLCWRTTTQNLRCILFHTIVLTHDWLICQGATSQTYPWRRRRFVTSWSPSQSLAIDNPFESSFRIEHGMSKSCCVLHRARQERLAVKVPKLSERVHIHCCSSMCQSISSNTSPAIALCICPQDLITLIDHGYCLLIHLVFKLIEATLQPILIQTSSI